MLTRGSLSTRSALQLQWPVERDNDIRVSGYVLEAVLDHFGEYQVIYDGQGHPEITSFTQPVT